eukprot:403376277
MALQMNNSNSKDPISLILSKTNSTSHTRTQSKTTNYQNINNLPTHLGLQDLADTKTQNDQQQDPFEDQNFACGAYQSLIFLRDKLAPTNSLQSLRQMQKLSLAGNNAKIMPPFSTLRLWFCQILELDISDNQIKKLHGRDLAQSLPFLKKLDVRNNKLSRIEDIEAFREHKCLEEIDFRGNNKLPFLDKRLILLQQLIMGDLSMNKYTQNSVAYLQATYQQIDKPIEMKISNLQVEKDKKYHQERQKDSQGAIVPRLFAYFKQLRVVNGEVISQYEINTIGYQEYESLRSSKNANVKKIKVKSTGAKQQKVLNNATFHKMMRDVKEKHDIAQTQIEYSRQINYPIKPEKIKVDDITISPKKLKKYEELREQRLVQNAITNQRRSRKNHIQAQFEEEKSDLSENEDLKDEAVVNQDDEDSSDQENFSEESDEILDLQEDSPNLKSEISNNQLDIQQNKTNSKLRVSATLKPKDLKKVTLAEKQELQKVQQRKANLIKKIKSQFMSLMKVKQSSLSSKESNDGQSSSDEEEDIISQLTARRNKQQNHLEFKPFDLIELDKPEKRLQISTSNILFDFFPTFNDMTTQQQLRKLEDFFNKSEQELIDALKDKETFDKIENDMHEVEKELAQGVPSRRKGFSFEDIRRFLKEMNLKNAGDETSIQLNDSKFAQDLVGVVTLYREERANELNLPKIRMKEQDIENILKSDQVLSTERFNRLTGILELTDTYKHYKEAEKAKFEGERSLLKFIKNKEAEEINSKILKSHRERIKAIEDIQVGGRCNIKKVQQKVNDIDHKHFALGIRGTVNLANNYGLSPLPTIRGQIINSKKQDQTRQALSIRLNKLGSTSDLQNEVSQKQDKPIHLGSINLTSQPSLIASKTHSKFQKTLSLRNLLNQNHHQTLQSVKHSNHNHLQTHRPAIMKGSIHEAFSYYNEQLNQQKLGFNLVRKFEKDIRLLPDFKDYDQDIEQNKQSLKLASKFYTYHPNLDGDSHDLNEDSLHLPAQYRKEIEQKRLQERKMKKIIIGSKYKMNNDPQIKYEEVTEAIRLSNPQYFKIKPQPLSIQQPLTTRHAEGKGFNQNKTHGQQGINNQSNQSSNVIESIRARRQNSLDNMLGNREIEQATLKAIVKGIIQRDYQPNPKIQGL